MHEVLVVGRGVYALPLLRILKASSAQNDDSKTNVTFATSVGWRDFGSVSRYVDETVHIPRADQDLEGFTNALCGIVQKKKNLIIIPVVEETLFLTLPKVVNRLNEACASENKPRIVTSSYQQLMELNDKFQFQKRMAKIFSEEQIPMTSCVNTVNNLVEAMKQCFQKNSASSRVVIKPVSGHGSLGAHLISRLDLESLSLQELMMRYPVPFDEQDSKQILAVPYVVQEFVEGHEYSTFSLCLKGSVVAHVCYRPRQVATHGFSPIRDLAPPSVYKKSLQYVQQVASSLSLTGHFGFDMMQQFTGELVALECNPRVTNGIAFLAPRFSTEIASKLKRAYIGKWETNDELISPAGTSNADCTELPKHIMTMLPTISCVTKAKNSTERMRLLEVAMQSHDDIWQSSDPLPFVMMVCRFLGALLRAILRQIVNPIVDEQGKRLKASEIVRSQVVDEVVCYDSPSEASKNAAVLETVGGLPNQYTSKKGQDKCLKVLVTGATGFLGGRVVRALHQGWDDKDVPLPEAVRSVTSVTATGRDKGKGNQLMQSLSQGSKVETRFAAADLSNSTETFELVRGHDVVIHCAALCSLWTRWDDYVAANVTAAENIAQACQLNGVRLLVHVSSPSLCTEVNTDDRFDITETDPLAPDDKQANRYSATKKMAETIVTDISRRYNLSCIILRPRAIFGPGDTTLFPLLLERLKSGKLAVVGRGRECLGDYTYVDNVVAACMCCLDKRPKGSPKVYTITNDDPRKLWDIIDRICDRMKMKKPWKRIPRLVAYNLAFVLEGLSALLMLAGYKKVPLFTRYTINVVSRSSTFDISAAKKELGYKPVVSFDEGCDRFLESLDAD